VSAEIASGMLPERSSLKRNSVKWPSWQVILPLHAHGSSREQPPPPVVSKRACHPRHSELGEFPEHSRAGVVGVVGAAVVGARVVGAGGGAQLVTPQACSLLAQLGSGQE